MKKSLTFFIIFIFILFSCKKENIEIVTTVINGEGKNAMEIITNLEKKYEYYVVNFFASYCSPCKKEMPDFEKIHKEYPDVFVASFSPEGETISQTIKTLAKLLKVTFPLYYNVQNKFMEDEINVVPMTYILDRDLKLIKKYTGSVTKSVIEESINRVKPTSFLPSNKIDNTTNNKMYRIRKSESCCTTFLIFSGNPPYKLGGENYPPIEIEIYSPVQKKWTMKYINGEYGIEIPGTDLEIKGKIIGFACTDESCFKIEDEFTINKE